MERQLFLFLVLLLAVSIHDTSLLFPVDDSILGSSCTRKNGLNGKAKMLQGCQESSPKEFIGWISGKGNVVCCPEKPRDIKKSKFPNTGDKAKAFCSDHSSTTLSPLIPKVIGGNFSDIGEFPHMAALGYENFDGDLEFKCGGALISHRFVLTAAHCMARDDPKTVRLGRTDLNLTEKLLNLDTNPAVDILVKSIKLHPDYTVSNKYNDIGLVELAESVTFTDNIRPVCLQVDDDSREESRKIIITGWGYIDKDRTKKSSWLMKANTVEIPLTTCRSSYENVGAFNLRKIMPQNVLNSQLCAHSNGIDTCQGDSGSPIQTVSNDAFERYYAVGVVSFGLGCASDVPTVYARISQYIQWIEREVWPGDSLE